MDLSLINVKEHLLPELQLHIIYHIQVWTKRSAFSDAFFAETSFMWIKPIENNSALLYF